MNDPVRRCLWLLACGGGFMAGYGACGLVTAGRVHVGQWYHPAELSIPFVPWTIVPYWSIDLLFVAAFFVAPDRGRLDALGRRVLTAIVLAGAGFLLLPLELVFPRPAVEGLPGALFDLLRTFDGPHNLFPSLHVAFAVILGDVHASWAAQRWGRAGRVVAIGWFVLVVLSTLTTWQHHVVDLVGGGALGLLCVYTWRPESRSTNVASSPRIGARYAAGALVAGAVAVATWPWGALLLWPATAMAILAAGYLGRGAWIYRKDQGRIPRSARWVLAPCRFGQWLSLCYYRRQCAAWSVVTPQVWLGRVLDAREARSAIQAGAGAVLDLTAEFAEAEPFLANGPYLNVPVLDLTAPTSAQLREAVAFVRARVTEGTVVYVHCKIGYSRSAAVVAAWLLESGAAASAEQAVAALRRVRPSLIVRPEAQQALAGFAAAGARTTLAAP